MREIKFKSKENVIKAVETFYSFKTRFNGQAVGAIAQELFVQIMNEESDVTSRDISDVVERHGREEDVAISFDGEDLSKLTLENVDNFYTASLKTASKKLTGSMVVQLTTNYKVRDLVDQYTEDIIDDDLETVKNSNEFDYVKKTPLITILFDEKTEKFGIFSFDFDELYKDTICIERRKNRVHVTYYLKNKNDKAISKILYGKNQANAFQRGVWITYNKETSKYFKPIVDWTNYNINKEFTFNFFN